MSPTAQLLVWLATLSAALGTLFPPVIALIQQEHWGSRTKVTVTLVLDAGAAVITVVGKGDWRGFDRTSLGLLAASFVAYFTTSGLTYDKLWQQFGVTRWIERVTTLAPIWRAIVAALPSSKQARIRDLENQVAALKAAALVVPPDPAKAVVEISTN